MKSQEKEFEVEAVKLLLLLLENTKFTLDELIDAKTYSISVNRHILVIGDHIENIDYQIYTAISKWLDKNKFHRPSDTLEKNIVLNPFFWF